MAMPWANKRILPFTSRDYFTNTRLPSAGLRQALLSLGTMAIFGKKKEKTGQQEGGANGNSAGSPVFQEGGSATGSVNGISSRSPPMGSGSRDGHGPTMIAGPGAPPPGMPMGMGTHGKKSSISGSGGAGVGSGFAANGVHPSSMMRPAPNGMQGPPPPQGAGPPGAAGGFKFGGGPSAPNMQSGIPPPGSQMRNVPNAGTGRRSLEGEGGQGQQTLYGQPGSGIIPAAGSGIAGLPSSSAQGPPIQGGPSPTGGAGSGDRPRTQQVVYPWSQRGLTMNPPRFLDESRQAPPGALSPSPFPRYGHAANGFASASGEVYLFGGLVRESVKNDLYVVYVDKVTQAPTQAPPGAAPGSINLAGSVNATLVQTTGEIPPPRVGHATVLVANVLILWGGDTKVRADDKQDEGLYLLNLSTREWTRVRQSSDNPNAGPVGRYGHTVAIVGSRFFVFGGQVDGSFMNDLWTFDLNSLKSTPTWDVLKPTSEMPPRRTGHASVTHKDKIYVFGGTDGQYHYNDTWCYDVATNSWKELSCIGYIPVPREGHAACLVDDVMYIFGGRGVDGKDLGDLASFRISNQRWYMFANMGPSPSGRSGHALTAYQNKVVVLGGESFTGTRPDDPSLVHVLDTAKIKYPPEGGSKAPTSSVGQTGRKSNIPGPSDAATRSMSPTERSVSPSQRGPRNDSLMGMMRPPTVAEQQQQQQQQALAQTQEVSGSKMGRPMGTEAAPARAMSPLASQQQPMSMIAAPPPAQSTRGVAPAPSGSSVTPYTGPKSQRSLENLRNGATSPPGGQINSRGMNGMTGAAAAAMAGDRGNATSPTAQDGFHYGSPQNGTARGGPAYQSTTSPIEVDMLRKREAWMKAALAMAVKRGFTMPEQLEAADGSSMLARQTPDFTLDDIDTGSDGSDKERVLRAVIALKTQLASAKATIAQQALGEADRVAEADRGRAAALSEAAFYRAKLQAVEGGNISEADRLQRGRNADVEKQLSETLRECGELERQLSRKKEELKLEQQLRSSAEERLSETAKRAMAAEGAQMKAHDELARLQKKSHQHESQLRDHKEKVSTLSTLASTHEGNHREAQRQLEEHQGSAEKHVAALKELQIALAASTARASQHEQLHYQHRDLVQQHDSTIARLKNELSLKSAEADNHSSRVVEMESLLGKHREEADSHKMAVNNGLTQILAFHQQQTARSRSAEGSGSVPTHVQERLKALQEESDSIRQLHNQSKQTADSANLQLQEMRERNYGLEKQQSGLKSELSAMRSQLSIALQEVARLKDHSSSKDFELRDTKRSMEATQVKHSLLRQLMVDGGMNVPGDDELSAKNGFAEKRIRELEEEMDGQARELQETEHRLRDASSRVEELSRDLEHANSRAVRGTAAGDGATDEELVQSQRRAEAAERELEETNSSYRERMSQLENDYQTAVQFVKGSEKMLRRMKDELTKYKTENSSLQSELISVRSGNYPPSSDNEAIRDIEALRTRLVGLTQENETVGAENRELERKMATLISEQKEFRDKNRTALDGQPSEGSRKARELETQVEQLEASLNDVRRELQETLALNTHLSNELSSASRGADGGGANGAGGALGGNATIAKDLDTAQLHNEQLKVDKENLAQRLQESEDKLQLLLGRMEGNESESNPGRDSHAFSISSELDKWERDRGTDAFALAPAPAPTTIQ